MDITMLIDMLANFAMSNPKLAGFFSVAYMIGLGAKTIREAVEKFILESPSKVDDLKLEEVKKSPAYKTVSMILDFLFRLKKPSK